MARDDIDVLILGREANARTVSDAARLWLAGTRAFSPGCVVVRRSAAVHLLANTDAVVPARLPRRTPLRPHVEPGAARWPRSTRSTACATRGASRVDGMSPMASALLGARRARRRDRRRGSALRRALGRPRSGEDRRRRARRDRRRATASTRWSPRCGPGVTPRELRGVCAAAVRVPRRPRRPRSKPSPRRSTPSASTWLPPDRAFVDGERGRAARGRAARRLGSVARAHVRGRDARRSSNRAPAGWDELVAACVPGTTAGALRARGAVVHGVGRGVEPWPDDLVLVPGLMRRDRAPRRHAPPPRRRPHHQTRLPQS